jgi:hypothetical protein
MPDPVPTRYRPSHFVLIVAGTLLYFGIFGAVVSTIGECIYWPWYGEWPGWSVGAHITGVRTGLIGLDKIIAWFLGHALSTQFILLALTGLALAIVYSSIAAIGRRLP